MKNTSIDKQIVHICLTGCEKRKLDAERLIAFFKENNYEVDLENYKEADYIVFVTCAFNEEFSTRSKDMIKDLLSNKKPNCKFILTGCLPDIWPEYIRSMDIMFL